MSREALVCRLDGLKAKEPAQCFVAVWTYLTPALLNAAEERLDAQGVYPSQLRNRIADDSPANLPPRHVIPALRDLLPHPESFDRLLLEWLIRLDEALGKRGFSGLELDGFDGRRYWIRLSNNFIADYLEARLWEGTWEAHQGASIATFARDHVAVPCEHRSGFEIACRQARTWAGRELSRRLLQVKRRSDLRILLWPFRTGPIYSGLDLQRLPPYFRLESIDNEPTISSEVEKALEVARQERATILVFPELSIPPAVDSTIRGILGGGRPGGHPLLTLYGCCHRRNDAGDRDFNEAVLLGPGGRELLPRHRKMVPYLHRGVGVETKEQLVRGQRLCVLESPLGNLVSLICLDFFHVAVSDTLADTHGNVFLVPSLSAKTTAHRSSAKRLQVRRKSSSFVCNRWLDHVWIEDQEAEKKPAEKGTSFFQVPSRGGYVTHLGDRPGAPYLLFSLKEERDRLVEERRSSAEDLNLKPDSSRVGHLRVT